MARAVLTTITRDRIEQRVNSSLARQDRGAGSSHSRNRKPVSRPGCCRLQARLKQHGTALHRYGAG